MTERNPTIVLGYDGSQAARAAPPFAAKGTSAGVLWGITGESLVHEAGRPVIVVPRSEAWPGLIACSSGRA